MSIVISPHQKPAVDDITYKHFPNVFENFSDYLKASANSFQNF